MKGDPATASNALVQTRINAEVKERATVVLESMGLTVSDAVRILLTRTANEGALPLELVGMGAATAQLERAGPSNRTADDNQAVTFHQL
ncbi:type II toxin-antitoxin system RelB/DinJ family antitoxin [Mesorhizobium sp. M0664]|uniref:type II toxin-antitoxin system RelB/DinJ family antitoxin n=1 Tax=Mesorhizobium sp. M0664 TaxID=2956982 RepID=UPI00333DBB8A